MPFEAYINQELVIDAVAYRVAEHPAAPGMPFGQEGRQAVVYQLSAEDDVRALKVFRPRFRAPSLVSLADQIAPLASLPGLQVCRRAVLTPSRHAELLRAFPDLIYAVLMPWVEGPVWQEVLLAKRTLTPEQSLGLARALARVLLTMEERGVAHCDLSAPNLILSPNLDRAAVALVDVEGICAPGLSRPGILPAGSPGYAHKTAPHGLWNTEADRFAGAVLLAEILGWSIADVRQAAWGENYFSTREMQLDNERYQILVARLRRHWGDTVANLFARAWHSDTLVDCPTLGEWLVGLPETAPEPAVRVDQSVPASTQAQVIRLVMRAEQAAGRGENDTALDLYRQAAGMAPPEQAEEIAARLRTLRPAPEPAGPPCRHCGRELATGSEVCPHCERGQEEPLPPPEEPTAPPTWRCPNCGRYAPAVLDVCPHCERGQRDATVEGTPTRAPVESAMPVEPQPARLAAARTSVAFLSWSARWVPVLMLGVGWALCWQVAWYMVNGVLSWRDQASVVLYLYTPLRIGLGGAIAGLIIGLILKWTERSLRARQVLLLALGWALSSAVYPWVYPSLLAPVGGVLGGLVTGQVLRKCNSLPGRKQFAWVVGGYAVAWLLGSIGTHQLYLAVQERSMSLARILQNIAFGGVAGAIGGGTLYWQLGRLTGRAVQVPASAELQQPPTAPRGGPPPVNSPPAAPARRKP